MSPAGNSLINGNLQGIVRFSANIERFLALENRGFPLISTTIPYGRNREFIPTEQGGNRRETGCEIPANTEMLSVRFRPIAETREPGFCAASSFALGFCSHTFGEPRLAYREEPNIDGDRAAERAKELQGRLTGLVIALLLAPVYFLVGHFTNESRGFVVFSVVGVFATIVYVLRRKVLRRRLLLPILFLFGIEVSAALLVPLPSKMPGFIMISIGTGDLVLVFWILSLFDRTLREDDDEGPRYSR